MPFVTCPECDHESKAPRELIGLEWACPKCGESFVVDDDEPRGIPRRRRKSNNTGRWVVLGFLLVATVFASVWAGVRWSRPRVQHVDPSGKPILPVRGVATEILPSPPDGTGEGPDWTYREMLDYLRSRGLPLKMGIHKGDQFYMLTDSDDDVTEVKLLWDDYGRKANVVTCLKAHSGAHAKELAGRHEKGLFSWGRWCFQGDDEALRLFHHALTERTVVTDDSPDLPFENVLARLRSRGLMVKMRPYKDGRDGRLFILTENEAEADLAAHLFGSDRLPPGNNSTQVQALAPRVAACIKYRFTVQAKSVWSSSTSISFAWGRFSFGVRYDSNLLDKVRSALGPP